MTAPKITTVGGAREETEDGVKIVGGGKGSGGVKTIDSHTPAPSPPVEVTENEGDRA